MCVAYARVAYLQAEIRRECQVSCFVTLWLSPLKQGLPPSPELRWQRKKPLLILLSPSPKALELQAHGTMLSFQECFGDVSSGLHACSGHLLSTGPSPWPLFALPKGPGVVSFASSFCNWEISSLPTGWRQLCLIIMRESILQTISIQRALLLTYLFVEG